MAKANREKMESDLAEVMFRKFLHANLYYFIAIICMTLFFVFAVQGALFHIQQSMSLAIIFYFFAVILFATGRVCFGKGMQNYRYH